MLRMAWFVPRGLYLTGLLGALFFMGCATERTTQIQEPFIPSKHHALRIEPCEDRTGFTGERNIKEEATRALLKKVTANRRFAIRPEAQLVLTCDIERFAEGSAFKRWLWPGMGATQAAITVMIWEKPGDRVLATLRSQSSVQTGGLYTIGADQYIFDVASEDIAQQLEAWAKGSAAETPKGE